MMDRGFLLGGGEGVEDLAAWRLESEADAGGWGVWCVLRQGEERWGRD